MYECYFDLKQISTLIIAFVSVGLILSAIDWAVGLIKKCIQTKPQPLRLYDPLSPNNDGDL